MWYHDMFGPINMNLSDKPKTVRKLAKYNHMKTWQMWFSILVQRALHRYTFVNLPDTINERVLRMSLLWHGAVCIFDYENSGNLMGLPGTSGTQGVTVYGDFTNSWVYGRNGWNKNIRVWVKGQKDLDFLGEAYIETVANGRPSGVWFRETELKFPFVDICIQFADAIADTWEKLDLARALTAKPFVTIGDEAGYETAKRFWEQMKDNVPFIYLSKKIAEEMGEIVPLQHNGELIKNYTDHIVWLLAQFDQLCGKSAMANPDKMSGMGAEEVNAGAEVTYATVDQMCAYMQEYGLDVVNEHFGTNIRVVPEGRLDYVQESEVSGLDQDAGPGAVGEGTD